MEVLDRKLFELLQGRIFVEILEEAVDKLNDLDTCIAKCVGLKSTKRTFNELVNIMRCYDNDRKHTVECKHLKRLRFNVKRKLKQEQCKEIINRNL